MSCFCTKQCREGKCPKGHAYVGRDGSLDVGKHKFTPNSLTEDDIRRIVREEIAKGTP